MITTNFIKGVKGIIFIFTIFLLFFYSNNSVEAANLVKPSITYLNGNPSLGSYYGIFWASTIPDSVTYTDYQIRVNSTIHDFKSDGRDSYTTIYLLEYNGFRVGQNDISVRICNAGTCGAWSEPKVIEIPVGWISLCTVGLPTETKTVTANSGGTVYHVNPSSGVFTTDSDLETVAVFLGAPIGGSATLQITNNGSCLQESNSSVTKYGIATTPFSGIVRERKRLTNITCVSGCTGNEGAVSTPSSGTGAVSGTVDYCLGDPAPTSQTVTATAFGSVYGKGPFTTGSSLGKIAAYLGAPIGSNATLSIADAGCLNNYRPDTKNGITTTPWSSTWRGMTVTCTSGCGTGTTNTTNTTTGTTNAGNNLGISGDLSSMSYDELLNTLAILTNYLNSLAGGSGTGNVGTTNSGTTNTASTGVCLGTPAPASQTVVSKNSPFEFVYGTGPFTTGSDLSKIATYLGAPIGSEAHLQITDIGCIENYSYTVQNGVTSIGWPAAWHGMTVVCTSGCTQSGTSNDGSGDSGVTGSTSGSNSPVDINNNLSVYNEPLNSKFPKPKINGSGGNTTQDVYFGQSIALFWAWSIPLTISYDTYQIKVNSTITEYDANAPAFSSKVTNLYINDIIGFKVADDNKLSVRVCDTDGCSQWSDPMTIDVWLGWTKNMCFSPIGLGIKVRVNNEGVVYGSGTSNSPFTTDSDLGTIAAFMGNKIGDVVTMNTNHNSMCMSTNDDAEVTKNGITTTPYNVNVKDQKRTMLVECAEGCTN